MDEIIIDQLLFEMYKCRGSWMWKAVVCACIRSIRIATNSHTIVNKLTDLTEQFIVLKASFIYRRLKKYRAKVGELIGYALLRYGVKNFFVFVEMKFN